MDTDDLSRETYTGILVEAEKLTHDLTLHFGLLSYDCKNETDYIEKAKKLTEELIKIEFRIGEADIVNSLIEALVNSRTLCNKKKPAKL